MVSGQHNTGSLIIDGLLLTTAWMCQYITHIISGVLSSTQDAINVSISFVIFLTVIIRLIKLVKNFDNKERSEEKDSPNI